MAASIMPYTRMMSNFHMPAHVASRLPWKWSRVWQGQLVTEELVSRNAMQHLDSDDVLVEDTIEDDD